MTRIDTNRTAYATHGARFSASDRPLRYTPRSRPASTNGSRAETREPLVVRARIVAAMVALIALVALAGAAPAALLVLLAGVAIAIVVVGGAFLMVDRSARPGDAEHEAWEAREGREAREARLEREVLAGMTPWRRVESGRAPRRRMAGSADGVPRDAADTAATAPVLDQGLALLGIAILIAVALLLPGAIVFPLAVALGAFTLLGLFGLPRRRLRPRAPRPASRAGLDASGGPASPTPGPNVAVPARGRRRELLVTAMSISAVAALLLALRTPERVALVLAGAGLMTLLGRRLLATRAGWPPRRPVRVRPAPEPAPAA
jgi:hypothetical protein